MTTSIKEILKARNVINQDLRKISSEDWFRSQPANIKANTIASQLLHQAIIAKNPMRFPMHLLSVLNKRYGKVWLIWPQYQVKENLFLTLLLNG